MIANALAVLRSGTIIFAGFDINTSLAVSSTNCSVLATCTPSSIYIGFSSDLMHSDDLFAMTDSSIIRVDPFSCTETELCTSSPSGASAIELLGDDLYIVRNDGIHRILGFRTGSCTESFLVAAPCLGLAMARLDDGILLYLCFNRRLFSFDPSVPSFVELAQDIPALASLASGQFQGQQQVPPTISPTDAPTDAPNVSPTPNVQIFGDPHFVGFLGQRFDFHGSPNTYFNLISTPQLQVNSLFLLADLSAPRKFKTYIGAIGLRLQKRTVRISCDRENSRKIVSIDNADFNPASHFTEDHVTYKLSKNKRFTLITPFIRISVRFSSSKHSSCHLNLRTKIISSIKDDDIHGILGQTLHENKRYSVSKDEQGTGMIDGIGEDYQLDSEDIFGTDFKFNKFSFKPYTIPSDLAIVNNISADAE